MSKPKKIAVILGARPNFVKAAPFFKEAQKHPDFEFVIIHTGQHFDKEMSEVFFEQMQIPKPHIQLDIKADLHTEKIGRIFSELKQIFNKEKFDAIIVFGDVNSTLAGAIAATKNNTKLIHIESGLRSHDRRQPEEINRAVADHLSDLLFTTEPEAEQNLLKEGILPNHIKHVGNIMIETMELFGNNIQASTVVEKLKLEPKKYVLATLHRQENVDSKENLITILQLLKAINEKVKVVLPLHPGTKKKLAMYGLEDSINNFVVTGPLNYFDFIKLMAESLGVITDSGGIQEETTHLGIPCVTLRDSTERPITVQMGSNKLFTLDIENVAEMHQHLARNNFTAKNVPLWDAKVSERIFNHLVEFFNDEN